MSFPVSVFCPCCGKICTDPVLLPCCSANVCENCAKYKLAKERVCFLCKYSSHVSYSEIKDEDTENNNAAHVTEEGISEHEDLVMHDKSYYCRVLSSTSCGQSKSLQIKAYTQGFYTNPILKQTDRIHNLNEHLLKIDDIEIDAGQSFLSGGGIPIDHVKSVLANEKVANKTLTSQLSHEVAQNMESLILCKSFDKIISSLKRKYQNNQDKRLLHSGNRSRLPVKIVDIASKNKDSLASALMENSKKRRKSTSQDRIDAKRRSISPAKLNFDKKAKGDTLDLENKLSDDIIVQNTSNHIKHSGNSSNELKCFNISEKSYSISDFERDKDCSNDDCKSRANSNQPSNEGKVLGDDMDPGKSREIQVENLDEISSEESSRSILQLDKAEINSMNIPLEERAKPQLKVTHVNDHINVDNYTETLENGRLRSIEDFEKMSVITEGDLSYTCSDIMDISSEKWPCLGTEILSSINQVQGDDSSKDHVNVSALQTEEISSSENFTNSESLSDLSSISSIENFSGS